MPAIVLIAIIGMIGGVLSGLFGIGGGLVIVPALILVAGFPIATAAGTSLAALLLPGQETSGPSPSATTNAPRRSMMCESPRDVPRTSSALPRSSTVSAAQAIADASGSSRSEVTVPPIRSV